MKGREDGSQHNFDRKSTPVYLYATEYEVHETFDHDDEVGAIHSERRARHHGEPEMIQNLKHRLVRV